MLGVGLARTGLMLLAFVIGGIAAQRFLHGCPRILEGAFGCFLSQLLEFKPRL